MSDKNWFIDKWKKVNINKTIKICLIYCFPIILFIYQLIKENDYIKSNWVLYLVGLALLTYCEYTNLKYKNNLESIIKIRRFYFAFFYFILIMLSPIISSNNINIGSGTNTLGLTKISFTYLILFIIGIIIYILIISNSNITEISVGNTKITMLKEKFEQDLDNHVDLTQSLLDKIKAENLIIQNLKKYCIDAASTNGDLIEEFQKILDEYCNAQKDDISMYVVDEINEKIRDDCRLKNLEFEQLKKRMSDNLIYAFYTDKYYMFIPYIEESCQEVFGEPLRIYIIVQSKEYIIEQESLIILNILKEFFDKLLVNVYVASHD